MELELVCPICLEDFDLEKFIPLVLVCGHTLCKNCLKSMLTRSSIECPQDRRRDMRQFEDIPQNYLLTDLITQRRIRNSHRCKTHPRKNSHFYCLSDDQNICAYCILTHRNHEIQSLITYEEEVKLKHLNQPPKLIPLIDHPEPNHKRLSISYQQLFLESTVLTPEFYTQENCNSLFPVNFQRISLRLLYRYSQDIPSNQEFHNRCDNKFPTLTVISANGCVFGGYTEIPWKSERKETGRYYKDDNSYVFALSSMAGMHAFKSFVKPKYKNLAVFHSIEAGPTFGAGFDLHLNFDDIRKSCSQLKAFELPNAANFNADEFLKDEIEDWDQDLKLDLKVGQQHLLANEFCNWALKDVEVYLITLR